MSQDVTNVLMFAVGIVVGHYLTRIIFDVRGGAPMTSPTPEQPEKAVFVKGFYTPSDLRRLADKLDRPAPSAPAEPPPRTIPMHDARAADRSRP